MHNAAHIVLGLAFSSLLGLEAGAAPRKVPTDPAPASRSRPKVVLEKVARPLTRKQLRPTKHKEASGALADLLVRIADGKAETKLEKKVAKRLAKSPSKREVMKRLATRWKSAPEDRLRKTIGRVDVGKKAQKGTLEASVWKASPTLMWLLRETIPLPPQDIPKPSSFQLELSGVQTIAAHDADGTDELSALTTFATPNGKDYDLVVVKEPNDGTFAAAGGATTSVGKTLYDGAEKGMLVITALVEDEGGNANASRAEVEVMVELAAGVAATLDGTDRLAVLEAMIDYTFGLDALDGGPLAASRSVACVQILQPEWYALWGTDPQIYDGVKGKLVVPHAIGSGQYELMLNVPSVLPPMRTVRVAIDKFWLDSYPPLDAYWRPWQLKLETSVGGSNPHTISLGNDVLTKSWIATYERKVVAGDVDLNFTGRLRLVREFPEHVPHDENLEKFCKQTNYPTPTCGEYVHAALLDLAPGSAMSRSATYDTDSNKIAGVKGRSNLNKLTSKGEQDPVNYIGAFKITVTDVAPMAN